MSTYARRPRDSRISSLVLPGLTSQTEDEELNGVEMEMDHMRDVLLATNNARCHNKSVRPSSLLSLPAPSRFMTLAYSFAASLAGRRTQRPSDGTEGGREEGRDGLGGQCEHRYLCVRCCGSRSPSLASPLLSSGEGEAGEARPRWTAQWLGRPTKEEGGPRATDRLVPPPLARRCLPYPCPPPLSPSFLLGPSKF